MTIHHLNGHLIGLGIWNVGTIVESIRCQASIGWISLSVANFSNRIVFSKCLRAFIELVSTDSDFHSKLGILVLFDTPFLPVLYIAVVSEK